jgi:hypothetical protein
MFDDFCDKCTCYSAPDSYQVDRVSIAWFKDLGPSKDSTYILSAVANLTFPSTVT